MHRIRISWSVVVTCAGLAGMARAQDAAIVQPVAVSTASETVSPVAVSTTPSVVQPVAVAVPVDANRNQDIVAWNKLDGTVQSVDRSNRLLTVQDAEGKNVRVAMNDRIRIYRGGSAVAYSDVSPNDHITLRYNEERRD
jgi:hypothetical protein